MSLPKRNSADGRCYWMKPEVQEELQPLFDQCIQDAIDGRITRLDSLWPPVVVSSEGAPFEVWQLLRTWTEAQRAETLDAEKAIAFSENLRRQSRWGEIDHHLLDMLQRELSHEKGAAALGQELSAFGWALYNLDDEDEYLFALIPEEERSEWERYCKKQGQYCHLMKQQGRKWGDHAKEQDPGKLMPCEEYILQDEYDYFFNSLAGDFAAGEWKNQDAEEWKNGCVADLRQRPPQVTRAHSLPHLGCLTYSAENGLYAASRAAGSGTIGRALLSKNPATLNWAEPSPIGYDGPPQTLCWADHSLWVGDPTNATRIELTDRGTCQDVKNWTLPEDGWSTKYHCGITTDGLGRVYFSNEWYKGQIYRWENGKVSKLGKHLLLEILPLVAQQRCRGEKPIN